MNQTFVAKVDAIISLLACAWQYQDYVPGAMKAAAQKWVSEPSPLDPPYVPPVPSNPDCNGRCLTCAAYLKATGKKPECPPEAKWKRECEQIRRRYRVGDVEEALLRLSHEEPQQAQAVWAVYVEPWPGALLDPLRPALGTRTEAIAPETRKARAALAEQGVEWMAWDIAGDVRAYGDVKMPTKEDQAAALISDGITSPTTIAQRLGCSYRHAKRLKHTVRVRCEREAVRCG